LFVAEGTPGLRKRNQNVASRKEARPREKREERKKLVIRCMGRGIN